DPLTERYPAEDPHQARYPDDPLTGRYPAEDSRQARYPDDPLTGRYPAEDPHPARYPDDSLTGDDPAGPPPAASPGGADAAGRATGMTSTARITRLRPGMPVIPRRALTWPPFPAAPARPPKGAAKGAAGPSEEKKATLLPIRSLMAGLPPSGRRAGAVDNPLLLPYGPVDGQPAPRTPRRA